MKKMLKKVKKEKSNFEKKKIEKRSDFEKKVKF